MSKIAAHQLQVSIIETDTVIVGAGAAGLSLAAALPHDLIVVESGGDSIDMQLQALHRTVTSGAPINPDEVRLRAIGGATTRWTGRCIELGDYDFEHRPWIAHTTWPIDKAALAPWYAAAWRSLGFECSEQIDRLRSEQEQADDFPGSALQHCLWRFTGGRVHSQLDLGHYYAGLFKDGSKRLLHCADVVELLSDGNRIEAVRIIDRSGQSKIIRARQFVITAGCVDSTKLLLQKRRETPALLGVVDPWLGRGFMQHLRIRCGTLEHDTEAFRSLQGRFGKFPGPGRGQHEIGLAIRPEFARAYQLGNASVFFEHTPIWSQFGPQRALRALSRLLGRQTVMGRGSAQMFVDIEQEVCPDSRIILHETLGPHDLPRAHVHWMISATDYRTANTIINRAASWLKAAGYGRLPLVPGIDDAPIDPALIVDSNHPLGGTRMSDSAASGVVDRDCRVHGTDNLWVVGGAVFATGGHANPTLTIVALAHRLADHFITRRSNSGTAQMAGPNRAGMRRPAA